MNLCLRYHDQFGGTRNRWTASVQPARITDVCAKSHYSNVFSLGDHPLSNLLLWFDQCFHVREIGRYIIRVVNSTSHESTGILHSQPNPRLKKKKNPTRSNVQGDPCFSREHYLSGPTGDVIILIDLRTVIISETKLMNAEQLLVVRDRFTETFKYFRIH